MCLHSFIIYPTGVRELFQHHSKFKPSRLPYRGDGFRITALLKELEGRALERFQEQGFC